jgi:serine phosphatase RsbU (regulator of sigma subunit)
MNCGHEPPFWVKDGGEVVQLTPTGPLVGVIPEAEFAAREIQMSENDTLVAFTDGVKDALNEAEEPFGSGRLQDVVIAGAASAAGLLRNIEDRLHEFTGAASQFDDITLMSVKRL